MDCCGSSFIPELTSFHWDYDADVQASKGIFGADINTALLRTNQQIFNEAEPILYQTRLFKIGVHLDEGLELLRSLSPRARRNVRAVYIALPYLYTCDGLWESDLDYKLQAWCKLCDYMSRELRLSTLSFDVFVKNVPSNFVDTAWVESLVKIRGLQQLMQRDLEWDEVMDYYGDFSALEPYEVLIPRLEALLSYLRSEMCQFPTSQLLTEKEREWDWFGARRRHWMGIAKSG